MKRIDYKEAQKYFGAIIKEEIGFSSLSPREQKVLMYRFGIDEEYPHTLEETGKEFGITRERIRQIETKALEKLRGCKSLLLYYNWTFIPYRCLCGKYQRKRYKGVICERCGVLVQESRKILEKLQENGKKSKQ